MACETMFAKGVCSWFEEDKTRLALLSRLLQTKGRLNRVTLGFIQIPGGIAWSPLKIHSQLVMATFLWRVEVDIKDVNPKESKIQT